MNLIETARFATSAVNGTSFQFGRIREPAEYGEYRPRNEQVAPHHSSIANENRMEWSCSIWSELIWIKPRSRVSGMCQHSGSPGHLKANGQLAGILQEKSCSARNFS